MALAVDYSFVDDKVFSYVLKENVTPRHRILTLDDIDPYDSILHIFREKFKDFRLAVPPNWNKNGHQYWSQCIGGEYLQSLINSQNDPRENAHQKMIHRWRTQLREVRDFGHINHIKTKDADELLEAWTYSSTNEPTRFAKEYNLIFDEGGFWNETHSSILRVA